MKNKNLKRFLAFVLSAAMVLTYMPSTMFAFAEEGAEEAASSEPMAAAAEEVKSEPAPAPKAEEHPAPAAEEKSEPAPAPAVQENTDSAPAAKEEATASEGTADTAADETAPADNTEAVTEEQVDPEAEAADVEKEEDVRFPEISDNKTVDGMTVYVSAPEGAFPEGTKISIKGVNASDYTSKVQGLMGDTAEAVKAVDISFHYEGKEIEPRDGYKVNVSFSSAEIADMEAPSVVHVPDKGAVEQMNANISGNTARFDSGAFSVYIIVDDQGDTVTYRRTYKFEDIGSDGTYSAYNFTNKAGETVNQQILKKGDALEPVGHPYHVGYDFEGWYIWDGSDWGSEVAFDDTSIVGDLTEDETVTVRAKYGNVVYLTFHENPYGSEEDIVLTTMAVAKDTSVAVNDVEAPLPGAEMKFVGWAIQDSSETVDNPYTAESDVDLYPIFTGAHWLRFVGNGTGASYTEAISVFNNQDLSTVNKPSDPTREGYDFAGWYDSAEGGSEFTWRGKLAEDTFVYAHWTPKDTEYSVFYWAENADDDNYTFVTSKKMTGAAGAQTVAADLTNEEKNELSGKVDWKGFEIQEIEQSTINGDGSTVVNVYYNRKIITLTFHKTDGGTPTYKEDPEGNYYRVSASPDGRYYYKAGKDWLGNDRYTQLTNDYYQYRTQGPLAYTDGDNIVLYERHSFMLISWYDEADATATVTRYSIDSGADTITISAKYGSDIHELWPENPGGGTDWYLDPYYDGTYLATLYNGPIGLDS